MRPQYVVPHGHNRDITSDRYYTCKVEGCTWYATQEFNKRGSSNLAKHARKHGADNIVRNDWTRLGSKPWERYTGKQPVKPIVLSQGGIYVGKGSKWGNFFSQSNRTELERFEAWQRWLFTQMESGTLDIAELKEQCLSDGKCPQWDPLEPSVWPMPLSEAPFLLCFANKYQGPPQHVIDELEDAEKEWQELASRA